MESVAKLEKQLGIKFDALEKRTLKELENPSLAKGVRVSKVGSDNEIVYGVTISNSRIGTIKVRWVDGWVITESLKDLKIIS